MKMPDEKTDELREKVKQLENEIGELKDEHKDSDKYASIVSRFAATVIDIVLVSVFAWVILILLPVVIEYLGAVSSSVSNNDIIYSLIVLLVIPLPFIYFMILEGGIGKGQTIGKRLLHIKVIKENGGTPSYFQSFIRTFTRTVDFWVISHIIGLITAAITDRRQRVGDIIAKTLVVKENIESPPKSKAEKQSGVVVIILAIFVIFMAIFAVLIVGIVLWQLGIFSGVGGGANSSTGFETGKIGIIDAGTKCTASDMQVIFTNQAGSQLTDIVAKATSGYCSGASSAAFNLAAGAKQSVTFTCTGDGAGAIGDRNSANLEVTFTEKVAGTQINRVQTGTIRCTVES